MMDEMRVVMAHLYVEERLAAAEKERLLHAIGARRTYFPMCAAWAGGALVRIGRRLETFGGATHAKAGFEMGRAV